jgi:hypothetical protein
LNTQQIIHKPKKLENLLRIMQLREKLMNILSRERYQTWGEMYDSLPQNQKKPTYGELVSELELMVSDGFAKKTGIHYILSDCIDFCKSNVDFINEAERRNEERKLAKQNNSKNHAKDANSNSNRYKRAV